MATLALVTAWVTRGASLVLPIVAMVLVVPVSVCAFNAPTPLASAVAMHALKMKCVCFMIEPHYIKLVKKLEAH